MENWRNGLNENQLKAASCIEGILLVLAGAGSGKTKTMTHRICHLLEDGVPASQILGITFTNKAAKEMRDRMQKLIGEGKEVPELKTFHSFGVQMIKKYGERRGYGPHVGICDAEDSEKRMKAVLKKLLEDKNSEKVELDNLIKNENDPSQADTYLDKLQKVTKFIEVLEKSDASIFTQAISKFKDKMMKPSDVFMFLKKQTSISAQEAIIPLVYKTYQDSLKKDNQVDFDDLIFETVELLKLDDINEEVKEQYRHLSVDEFQDTSYAQNMMVELLFNPQGSLCVVGDDYQSIYAFRGAVVENILQFPNEAKKLCDKVETVELGENYRSTQVIVNAAADLIKNNKNQYIKKLKSMNEYGDAISLTEYQTDKEEASEIKRIIKKAIKSGKSYKDFAILGRNNSISRAFEEEFVRDGIPYKIFGGVNFYQRAEIKDIIAYLRLLAGYNDTIAFKRAINTPKRGIGEKCQTKILLFYEDCKRKDENISLMEAFQEYLKISKGKELENLNTFNYTYNYLKEELEQRGIYSVISSILAMESFRQHIVSLSKNDPESLLERTSNVEQLALKATDFTKEVVSKSKERLSSTDILDLFLEEISLFGSEIEEDKNTDYVSIMTMHKSKGLEFNTVFIVGCLNYIHPDSDISEERRLFYVAMTRAQKKLYISKLAQKFDFKIRNYVDAKPLMFLNEIPGKYLQISSSDQVMENSWYNKRNENVFSEKKISFSKQKAGFDCYSLDFF